MFTRFSADKKKDPVDDGIRVRPGTLTDFESYGGNHNSGSPVRPELTPFDSSRCSNTESERPARPGKLESFSRRLSGRKFDREWNSPSELESRS